MPSQAIGIRAAQTRPAGHLEPRHPLAEVAARHCHPAVCAGPLIGGVACGTCWEQAIRRDEQIIAEFDLPRQQQPDPLYVDPVAVERALRGHPVRLFAAEWREVVRVWSGIRAVAA